jgi:aryl carrier-like protein
LDDGALLQQSWDRFERVLAPKVQGAWNLHELTQGMALDFFVVFSSASALLGNRGQSNYVAANTFLDALAHYRRVRGLPALSINWGAWAEVGLAAEMVRTQGAQLAAQGIGAIAPAEGVAAFLHLLAQSAVQAGVAPIHWPRFLKHVGQDAAFYAAFRAEVQPPSTHRAGSVSDLPPLPDGRASARAGGLSDLPIRRQLALAASESERSELLRTYLIQQAAQVLRTAPAELDAGEALTYLGLDSLMALELRNRIDSGLQLSVPVPQLLQGASISDLQQLLLEKLKESNPSGPGVEPVNTAGSLPLDLEQDAVEMLAHLDELSEENVDLLLERLLAEEESGA